MADVEIFLNNETTRDIINVKIFREKQKDPEFEDAFYVTDLGDICRKMRLWRRTLPRVEPHFAVKCNDDMTILKTLAKLGSSFDCASKDEISRILELGVSPSKIVYSHPIKPKTHLRYATEKHVDKIVFDAKEELMKIKECFPKASLLLRIRPEGSHAVDVSMKGQYGCHVWEARDLLQTAKEQDLDVVGVCFHVGSGITEGRVFEEIIQQADQVFTIALDLGYRFTLLDVGGGFIGHSKQTNTFKEVADVLNETIDRYFPPKRGVKIIAEPGRYFVSSAQTLVLPIIGKKVIPQDPQSTFPNPECCRMYFLGDGIYGSFHHFFYSMYRGNGPELLKPPTTSQMYRSSVWGPSLSPLDCIFKDCELPDLEMGDWLYLANMGAYTLTINKGDVKFNGFESPKIFYVCDKDTWKDITCPVRL